MLDEELFHCFGTPALIDGEKVSIGVAESTALKYLAVLSGFLDSEGRPQSDFSWIEALLIQTRSSTTPDHFNHEWWGAQTLMPEWARRVDEIYKESWLYFPKTSAELTPATIGKRLGYIITLSELKLEKATEDSAFITQWEAADLEKTKLQMPEDLRDKTRVVLTGFDTWEQFAKESYAGVRRFREFTFDTVAKGAPASELREFLAAFEAGAKRASEVDFVDQLSEYSERQEVISILSDRCMCIDKLKNRAEITKFVIQHLSGARKKFLGDGLRLRAFTDRMREIYEKIGLKPAGRGRPSKNGENGSD